MDNLKNYKTFEGIEEINVNDLIKFISTLEKMSEVTEMLKKTKPRNIRNNILSFLAKNEQYLDENTVSRIKYIAQIWKDAFEGTEIVFSLKRRIDPIVEELKKIK